MLQEDVQEAYTDSRDWDFEFEEGVVPNKTGSGKRELIDTGKDKRYVRRDAKGQFKESDNQSRSLAKDVKQKAVRQVKAGQGDRGDQKRT